MRGFASTGALFPSDPNDTMNQDEIDKLTERLRDLYRTSEGPRILAEIMQEFPYPRKLWNDKPDRAYGIKGGWGRNATACIQSH